MLEREIYAADNECRSCRGRGLVTPRGLAHAVPCSCHAGRQMAVVAAPVQLVYAVDRLRKAGGR